MIETDLDDYDLKTFDRLFDRVVEAKNDCLVYTWGCDKDGYGWLGYRGTQKRASQLAYYLCVGDIPAGMHVLHTCDNPPCCNPEHLFLGNDRINTDDKMAKGRHVAVRGSFHSRALLREEDIVRIRELREGGWKYKEIAEEFNVGISCINHILHRRSWQHVEELNECKPL